jgi:hypothetical protein
VLCNRKSVTCYITGICDITRYERMLCSMLYTYVTLWSLKHVSAMKPPTRPGQDQPACRSRLLEHQPCAAAAPSSVSSPERAMPLSCEAFGMRGGGAPASTAAAFVVDLIQLVDPCTSCLVLKPSCVRCFLVQEVQHGVDTGILSLPKSPILSLPQSPILSLPVSHPELPQSPSPTQGS